MCMDKNSLQSMRDKIILQALPDIVFDGWSDAVITKAANDVGVDEDALALAMPHLVIDALDGFADYADRQMLEKLDGVNPDDLRIRDRVRTGIMARFEVLSTHKEAVRAGLNCLAYPSRHVRAGQLLWRTADKIWDWAGDTSRDYNRYTKRGLLSGIIASATWQWLDDDSEAMDATQAFVDRRIENVMQLNMFLGRFKNN